MSEEANPAVAGQVERRVMQRDATLEALSDKVRRGEPIGFLEAIAVVNYQRHLRAEREARYNRTFLGRMRRWFRDA